MRRDRSKPTYVISVNKVGLARVVIDEDGAFPGEPALERVYEQTIKGLDVAALITFLNAKQ